MATNLSIALRNQEAQDRIAKAAGLLAKDKGIKLEEGAFAPPSRHPEMAKALQLEAIADFLESVTGTPSKGATKMADNTNTPADADTQAEATDLALEGAQAQAEATELAKELKVEGTPPTKDPASIGKPQDK